MNISLKLNEQDKHDIAKYAKLQGLSVDDFIRETVLNRIDDLEDIADAQRISTGIKAGTIETISLEELEKNPNKKNIMNISLNLSEKDKVFLSKHAKLENLSIDNFIKEAIIEEVETAFDMELADEGRAAYELDPTTYTFAEVCEMIGYKRNAV